MSFISNKLKGLIKEGKLSQVVVVDSEGFVIETFGESYEPDVISAAFSPLYRYIESVQETLQIEEVEEITLRTEKEKNRIILRNFIINESKFLLIAVLPVTSSYRQLMTEIIQSEGESIIKKAASRELADGQEELSEEKTTEQKPEEKEVEVEEKKAPVISDELIDLVSDKVLNKLFYSFIEKIVEKKVLEIADDLIKKEIEKAKKEYLPSSS